MYTKKDISIVANYMLTRKESLSVAESVTSGHIQAALSLADNARKFFQGGITVYNLGQKSRHLHVEPIHAESCNCVSERIAQEMAVHACALFSSDWGIGITGYAVPVPECDINSLFSYYAISYHGKVTCSKLIESRKKGIQSIQEHYVNIVMRDFAKVLTTHR
jgi:nicotinamide-nucleotide amidase